MGNQKVMTVGRLAQRLADLDPDTPVLIDNHGEYRTIGLGDVRAMQMVDLDTEDGVFRNHTGPAIVIVSWS